MRLISTRDPRQRSTFLDALQSGPAPGGGLWVPEPLPCFRDVLGLLGQGFHERSVEILSRMVGDEVGRGDLEAVVAGAFDFPLPLVEVRPQVHVLELFHGPTLAFKDFGTRFLARVLALRGGPRTVLTATSGDTGAAAAHAFWRVPGTRVVVLYPKGRVSPLQERLFTTLGDNVTAYAVEGSFDDCQALVRGCFEDQDLVRRLGLTSANSINLARVLAQVLCYFEGAAQLRAKAWRDEPVFCVPCGNFGNLYAGLLAQRMGLPVRSFIVATNANRAVPDHLDTGTYTPRPAVPTLSSAMDVGHPGNWERITHLFGDRLGDLRAALRWGSLGDGDTRRALWELKAAGYLADPHTAVGYGVMQGRMGLKDVGILLATAHPAKFQDVLERNMNIQVPLPEVLSEALAKPSLAEDLPNDLGALKACL